jgi:tocopherol cyclase
VGEPSRLSAGDSVPGWTMAAPYPLRRIWMPDVYQGGSRRSDYFEGWYLKCVDGGQTCPIAFIPGVSHDEAGGTSHAFVQIVRPGGATTYLEYPVGEFTFDRRRFEVTVGPNRFSSAGVVLDIARDGIEVRGELAFGSLRSWPVSALTPGIMGWYRFVPRMECYHAVCSLDHEVSGTLRVDGASIDFAGGRGYAEKDWGGSFPSSWVWAQSNHFDEVGTCITLSVARIQWMGGAFVGFIAGVLVGGSLYRFTTYTGARLTAFSSVRGGAALTLEDGEYRLDVDVDSANPAPLKAPTHGRMVARADESLDARIRAKLTRKRDGAVLLDGVGVHSGVEVMDEKRELEMGVSRLR